MIYLSGLDGFLIVGGVMAIVAVAVTFWIRWEDRHKHPPAPHR